MAIQANITYNGKSFENSYIRVESYHGDKNEIVCTLLLYRSLEERVKNIILKKESITLSLDPKSINGNFYAQIYTSIKSDRYVGATDV